MNMPNMAGLSNAGKIEELEKAVNMLMKAGKPKLPVGTCVMRYQKADNAGFDYGTWLELNDKITTMNSALIVYVRTY